MYGKTFIWQLRSGGKTGQQTREMKLAEGYAFIKRLEEDGEVILHIDEQHDKIVIQLEDK
jgi:hypothetical protein